MYNALLDRLPEDYNGWLIRTDYRIGVQIQLCLSDPDLSDSDKTVTALQLLYGRGIPDIETAIEGVGWFLSCGNPVEDDGGKEEPVYSFEQDAGRIVSAFKKVYGRDISREKLQWFEFVPMLGDFAGTAFTSVIDIRTTNVSWIISESGLYNVIFRSDKPEARDFRRWVTHEVLPSIRRTGAYGMVMPSVYPPKATSVGEVAQLLRILRVTMKDNRQPPEKVSEMVESVCSQFGIVLTPDFVKEDLFQFAVIGKLIPV